MSNQKYIPALRFHWLTGIYDWLISAFMPEIKFKQAVIDNAHIKANDTVLDFGVGTATLSIMAYNQFPNADYTGINIDEKILAIASKKISAENAVIKLVKYEGGVLPFSNNSFNTVMSRLVIHHLATEQKTEAFKEFYRVLKTDGELNIADWRKPTNLLMRLCFHIVQLLDGYKPTSDNVKGKLPQLLKAASFSSVTVTNSFNSVLGTIQVYTIIK